MQVAPTTVWVSVSVFLQVRVPREVCGNLLLSVSVSVSVSLRKRDREGKKEVDIKRCVFVNFTFILSGEWILTGLHPNTSSLERSEDPLPPKMHSVVKVRKNRHQFDVTFLTVLNRCSR